jgi:hypothetical protein
LFAGGNYLKIIATAELQEHFWKEKILLCARLSTQTFTYFVIELNSILKAEDRHSLQCLGKSLFGSD